MVGKLRRVRRPLRRVSGRSFTFLLSTCWGNSTSSMNARTALALLLSLCGAGGAAAQSGDQYCDPHQSTADTCVIVGTFTVPDASVLTFTLPNVDLRGTFTVQFAGACTLEPNGPCASDADCAASGPCQRTGRITLQAAAALGVDS